MCVAANTWTAKAFRQLSTLRPEDEDMELLPWVDPENFNPGYLMRSIHLMPKQGASTPGNTLKTIGEIKTSYRCQVG